MDRSADGDGPMEVRHVLAGLRDLPIADPSLVGSRFAVLAPHPDDESLGCGGLIAAACARGTPPRVLVLTDGGASHPDSLCCPPPALAAMRANEVRAATRVLGVPAERLHLLGLIDGAAPRDAPGVERTAARVAELAVDCDTLLVSWRHDPHPDHQAAWLIARQAAALLGARLLEYPIWGWTLPSLAELPATEWTGWRIDVSQYLPRKRQAIAAHRSQLGTAGSEGPDGWVLPPDFLALFDQPWETLVQAP